MITIQNVIDLSRIDLNDMSTSTANYRYPDSQLISFANDGIAKAVVIRPDFNFGNYTGTFTDLVSTSSFPLPIEYRVAIVSYVTARAQSGDDAFVLNQRADLEMALYLKELGVGGVA